jgi:hypothetical protein
VVTGALTATLDQEHHIVERPEWPYGPTIPTRDNLPQSHHSYKQL